MKKSNQLQKESTKSLYHINLAEFPRSHSRVPVNTCTISSDKKTKHVLLTFRISISRNFLIHLRSLSPDFITIKNKTIFSISYDSYSPNKKLISKTYFYILILRSFIFYFCSLLSLESVFIFSENSTQLCDY